MLEDKERRTHHKKCGEDDQKSCLQCELTVARNYLTLRCIQGTLELLKPKCEQTLSLCHYLCDDHA